MKTLYLSFIIGSGITTILTIYVSVFVMSDANADQTLQSYVVNGTITALGCHVINGEITNQTTMMYPIQICHYKNSYFQMREIPPGTGCSIEPVYWKDPISGRVYTFPTSCDTPHFIVQENGTVSTSPPYLPPSLAKVGVKIDSRNVVVITGMIYKIFSNIIEITIFNPQKQLILVSQEQPTENGSFSMFLVPRAPLWSEPGNYAIRVSSSGQNLAQTMFYFNGTNCCPTPSIQNTASTATPIEQLKAGVLPKDIICRPGLQLVLKAEDNSPACVNRYVALRLAQIGWTTSNGSEIQQLPDPSSALKLNLVVSPDIIKPKEPVEIKISVNNTYTNTIYVKAQNNWAFQDLDNPCKKIHLGIAILAGYYTVSNMTEGKSLQLFNRYDCPSWQLETGRIYEFQPQSDQVNEIICYMYFGEPCHSEGLNMNYGFDGYWDKNNTKQPFDAGNYTVIGADEWGHLAIQYFTVVKSTSNQTMNEYTTSVSQPVTIPSIDIRGTIKNIATSTPFMELASSSTGISITRGGCCDSFDNDSIKLESYHGKRSNSDIIAATVANLGKRTIHIYGIHVSGFISITNSTTTTNLRVLEADPNVVPKEDAILEPGESQTKYIVGNWTWMGKPVNGFSVYISYSYENLQNYNGMTNGYDMTVPIQWIQQ